jgi:hypothetical protein
MPVNFLTDWHYSEEGFFFDMDEKNKGLCGDLLSGFNLYRL